MKSITVFSAAVAVFIATSAWAQSQPPAATTNPASTLDRQNGGSLPVPDAAQPRKPGLNSLRPNVYNASSPVVPTPPSIPPDPVEKGAPAIPPPEFAGTGGVNQRN